MIGNRIEPIGYHILNPGNGRAIAFHTATDNEALVRLIEAACARIPMWRLAWRLMPNRFDPESTHRPSARPRKLRTKSPFSGVRIFDGPPRPAPC